jgi:CheY-specific phosphatase CheX
VSRSEAADSLSMSIAKLAPNVLAGLVSKVMATSCGINFLPFKEGVSAPVPWRAASLPINGGIPVAVGITSDERGCLALASGLLQMPASDLDTSMVEDSLRELVNMLAGQVKRAMSLDLALGLPEIVPPTDVARRIDGGQSRSIVVTSGSVALMCWVTGRT